VKLAIFVDSHGNSVRINPATVTYVSDLYKESGVTTIYFSKEHLIQVKADLDTVTRELANPRGS
jgi:hypothetical protein